MFTLLLPCAHKQSYYSLHIQAAIYPIAFSLYPLPHLAQGCSGIVWVKTKLCVSSYSQLVLKTPKLLTKETLQGHNFLQFAQTVNLKVEH